MPTDVLPPQAAQHPHTLNEHGAVRHDPYFWLRQRDNPEVMAYLEAENSYAQAVLEHTVALQQQLYMEMRGRIKEQDEQVPAKRGPFLYYERTEAGQQYPIYCRKPVAGDIEEVLLDQNQLATGHAYCRIGAYQISPNHHLLAYSVDIVGDEKYTLYVKNLQTGELLTDQVPNTYYSVAWANDNQTIFYNVLDAAQRPYQVYRHTVGTDAAADVLIYHEQDEAFFLGVKKTRSERFLLLTLRSTTTNEVHFAPADDPHAPFVVVQPRVPGLEYAVDHHGDHFLIKTNDQAKNFKLVAAPIANPGKEQWRDLVPHRSTVLLDDIDVFAEHLVLYEREGGLQRIAIRNPDASDLRYVPFPEATYTFDPGPNHEWDTAVLRFTYSSLVTPDSVVDYDMGTETWQLRKQDEIPSGYDPTLYHAERLHATSADGVEVPMSVVYRKGLVRDGSHPLLLYGYGSYGFTIDPGFRANRLSLLDRGWVFVIAHIRGGSDLGREWYEHGKLLHKKNTFADFIACAEHLIREGYTSSARLAIMGGSAGGLLMGAVVNARPDLFKAVVAQVPFVDVISTMRDPSLPLTVIEYEQWGNPNDKPSYDYMLSYSPYDNVEAKAYPNILATAGLNDPRVSYWEPAKWVAKLRALKTDDNLLLLKTNMEAGHGGASGRFDYLEEVAFEYAFLLEVVGQVTHV